MQVKSIAEWEHSAILSTFIKLPFVIKIFVMSSFEWPFYTCFTVTNIRNCDRESVHALSKYGSYNEKNVN